jgi:hypothetical protein
LKSAVSSGSESEVNHPEPSFAVKYQPFPPSAAVAEKKYS